MARSSQQPASTTGATQNNNKINFVEEQPVSTDLVVHDNDNDNIINDDISEERVFPETQV
jgi:hypothetical protein